jgi:hypothetical protein
MRLFTDNLKKFMGTAATSLYVMVGGEHPEPLLGSVRVANELARGMSSQTSYLPLMGHTSLPSPRSDPKSCAAYLCLSLTGSEQLSSFLVTTSTPTKVPFTILAILAIPSYGIQYR